MDQKVIDALLHICNSIVIIYFFFVFSVGFIYSTNFSFVLGVIYIIYSIFLLGRSILGIIAVARKLRPLLLLYIIMIIVTWVIGLIAFFTLIVYLIVMGPRMTLWLSDIKKHNIAALHRAERWYSCCGINGSKEYMEQTELFSGSCCGKNDVLNAVEMGECTEIAKKRRGCLDTMVLYYTNLSTAVLILQVVMVLLEVTCFVLAIISYKRLRPD